ncbi:hypothetical protein BDV06DRAFT_195207 [Aspergillus oleicola]
MCATSVYPGARIHLPQTSTVPHWDRQNNSRSPTRLLRTTYNNIGMPPYDRTSHEFN